MVNTIIIGAGPAGISASLYLARANMTTIVIHNNKSNLRKAYKIDNYYGKESVSGEELYKIGIKQAKDLGVPIKEEEVLQISYDAEKFTILTDGQKYQCKNLILATGKSRTIPNIKGLKEYVGSGVSFCAICDAYFYKNKHVAVLGDGNYALHEATILKKNAQVTLLSNGKKRQEMNCKKIKEIHKEGTFIIEFEDQSTLSVDGIFVAYGANDIDTLSSTLGLLKNKEFIKVDENNETNIPHLYACGDITGGILQITKAVTEGMNAALHIIKRKEEKR